MHNEQVVVISGGSGGLGKATAQLFLSLGNRLYILDNDLDKIKQMKDQEPFKGNEKCTFFQLEIADEKQVVKTIAQIRAIEQKIDVLVNCAGISRGPNQRKDDGSWKPMEDVSLDDWQKVIDINLTGTFLLCREVAKVMIKNRWGRIINTASISGLIANRGLDGLGPYSASKGAVITLTKVLAVEWAKHNITVNAISPGYMATEMGTRSQTIKGFKELQLSLIPQGRLGNPNEYAETVYFLASEGASHITGHNLVMDGGYTSW